MATLREIFVPSKEEAQKRRQALKEVFQPTPEVAKQRRQEFVKAIIPAPAPIITPLAKIMQPSTKAITSTITEAPTQLRTGIAATGEYLRDKTGVGLAFPEVRQAAGRGLKNVGAVASVPFQQDLGIKSEAGLRAAGMLPLNLVYKDVRQATGRGLDNLYRYSAEKLAPAGPILRETGLRATALITPKRFETPEMTAAQARGAEQFREVFPMKSETAKRAGALLPWTWGYQDVRQAGLRGVGFEATPTTTKQVIRGAAGLTAPVLYSRALYESKTQNKPYPIALLDVRNKALTDIGLKPTGGGIVGVQEQLWKNVPGSLDAVQRIVQGDQYTPGRLAELDKTYGDKIIFRVPGTKEEAFINKFGQAFTPYSMTDVLTDALAYTVGTKGIPAALKASAVGLGPMLKTAPKVAKVAPIVASIATTATIAGGTKMLGKVTGDPNEIRVMSNPKYKEARRETMAQLDPTGQTKIVSAYNKRVESYNGKLEQYGKLKASMEYLDETTGQMVVSPEDYATLTKMEAELNKEKAQLDSDRPADKAKYSTLKNVGFQLSPMIAAGLSPSIMKDYEDTMRQNLIAKGFSGGDVEAGVRAGVRDMMYSGVGEIAGILYANTASEVFGQTLVASKFTKEAGTKGAKAAKLIYADTPKTRFVQTYKRTFGPIFRAGVGEGASVEVAQEIGRDERFNPKKVVAMGLAGGAIAGTIGATVAGLSAMGTKSGAAGGKALLTGVRITDPSEYPGDVWGEKFLRSLVPKSKTYLEPGLIPVTTKLGMGFRFGMVPSGAGTSIAVRVPVASLVPTITGAPVTTMTPTSAKTPASTRTPIGPSSPVGEPDIESLTKSPNIIQSFKSPTNIAEPAKTPTTMPVPDTTNVFVSTRTPTDTPTSTAVPVGLPTLTSTAVPVPIPVAVPTEWPWLGGLGEGTDTGKGVGGLIGGVNVNYLRNFFFEKVQMEKPVQMRKGNAMLSTSPVSTSIKPVDVTKRLGDVLGKSFYTGIVSNSTPFPKTLPKKVKSKKARL